MGLCYDHPLTMWIIFLVAGYRERGSRYQEALDRYHHSLLSHSGVHYWSHIFFYRSSCRLVPLSLHHMFPANSRVSVYQPPATRTCFQNSHLPWDPMRSLPLPTYPAVTFVPVVPFLVKFSTLYSPWAAYAGHAPSWSIRDCDWKVFGDARL